MKSKKEYSNITKDYYNSRFGKAFQNELNKEERLRWEMINRHLIKIILKDKIRKPEILDFGCANGRFSFLMSKYGDVTGLDYAEKAIQTAKDNFPEIKFYTFDASRPEVVDFIGKKFDIIISSEVIEHIIEQNQYLSNIEKLLKPNGYLIMTTPNKRWFDQFFQFGKKKSSQPFELWLSSQELTTQLTKLNFLIHNNGTFRSNWIFIFKTYGLLKTIGNRLFHKLIRLLMLKKIFLKIGDKMGLGIYLIVVAKKKNGANKHVQI